MNREQLSKSRKLVTERLEKLVGRGSQFLEVREPLVHGWVRRNRRKCGHSNCRCARGELHETQTFGTREGGKEFHRGIPPENLSALKACTKRWRRYRAARAQLVKDFHQLLEAIDGLEEQLSEPWKDWITPKTKPQRKETS